MKTQNFGRSIEEVAYNHILAASDPYMPQFISSIDALKNYKKNRENGEFIDNPKQLFPTAGFDKLDIKSSQGQAWNKWPDSCGRYWWEITLTNGQVINDFYWMEDKIRGWPDKNDKNRYWFIVYHTNGTKIEGFSQEPDYDTGFPGKNCLFWRYIQFTDTHCPAIAQWMKEKDQNYLLRTLIKILYQPSKIQGGINIFTELPEELQLMVFEFVIGDRLSLDIFRNAKDLAMRKELSVSPIIPILPKLTKKQITTNQPVLNNSVIDPLALNICYEDIRIINKLGEDAFGIVSYGEWRNENVAVKRLHIQKMSENALIEFKKEAGIMSCLCSNYIVKLKGICIAPYALVMEYRGEGSLFSLLHSDAILSWPIRRQISLDVAKGLAFLHNHQPNTILHRALKSQNILLNKDHRAKLADFGLAKVRIESARQTHAQSTLKSVSTISWMGPECFGAFPKHSQKSDIYAYGMVLWEIAARKIPYEEVRNPNKIRDMVCNGQREKIPNETTNPSETIPLSYKKFIRACWFQNPGQRPTAKEAIETLQQSSQRAMLSPHSSSSSLTSGI